MFPKRNSENGYRVYDENEIWRIKVIKMLRMLDMPLEEIKKVLEEEQLFSLAIVNQHEMYLLYFLRYYAKYFFLLYHK